MKTRDEVEELKKNWSSDPCWDIEDAEGFEDHRAELVGFRRAKTADWERERICKSLTAATRWGVTENGIDREVFGGELLRLERKISLLMDGFTEGASLIINLQDVVRAMIGGGK